MSLQIWLPLNGNINNCGVCMDDLTGSSITYSTYGKVCEEKITAGNVAMSAATAAKIFNNKAITIAFWIYPNKDTGSGGGCFFGTEGMSANNNRKFSLFGYPTINDLHWSWQNDTANQVYTNGVLTGVLPSYTWTHVTVVYENPKGSIYINGQLKSSFSGVSNSSSFAYVTTILRCLNAYHFNDLRIYDHAISKLEISEISKGLKCHYTLSDPYPTASVNKYSGEAYEGKPEYTAFTVTKLTDERGYNYKLSYTGNGNNTWRNFHFPAVSFTPNKKYVFSCKIRKNSGNGFLSLRAARIQNDYETANISVLNAKDNKWHEYSVVATMPATYTRSGTTYNVAPRVEFYTGSLNVNGTVYTYDFDVKDVQIAECDSFITASNGSFGDGIVYDVSGHGYNGITAAGSRPKANAASPRYSNSYQFEGAQQIQKIKNPLTASDTTFSISFWINAAGGTQTIYTARTGVGLGIAVFWIGNHMRLDDGIISEFSGYTMPNGQWTFVCITRDTKSKKLYINGELKQTISSVGDLTNIGKYGTIGASESQDSGIGNGNYLTGSLSDFKIYATALTAEQIKEMYQVSASVDKNGTLMIKGGLVEE